MKNIQIVRWADGVNALVTIEKNTVFFPAGTQYRSEGTSRPEQVIHFWMLPSGHILSYTEMAHPDEVEYLKETNRYIEPCLVIQESPEDRKFSEKHGWQTWKQELFFE